MLLQDKLDAFKANFESGGAPFHAPAAVHEPMRRATADLVASGLAGNALGVGDLAPSFELSNAEGVSISSSGLLARGPLVLTFYRGFWCPYCNIELESLQAALPAIEARGATLVALSPQTAANSRRAKRDKGLSFDILFDSGNEVAASFGLRFKLPDYLIELYRDGFDNDLTVTNGDPSWTLPIPARYIIDASGSIAYSEVNPDYTKRPDPGELLPILDQLKQRTAA